MENGITGNKEGQQHQEREEEVESSNANRDGDQQEVVADSTAKQAAALSMKDMLEAMKVMGNQVVAMTQLFTLLVNSSVGQATLVATATPVADGPAVETAEVVEIDPPVRTVKKVDYLSLLQHISRLGTNTSQVVLEKANQEDLGRSQKSKEAAGQSSQVAADGTNPTGLPTDPVVANTGGELPADPTNPTGTHQGNKEGQQHQEREEEVESSNANRDGDQQEVVADSTAKQAAALSMKDMLEAMKVMGNQVVAMTQLFTLLVNSSVGQATLVATATPVADGPAVETAEVVEIDPPVRTVKKVDYLSLLQHISRLGTNNSQVLYIKNFKLVVYGGYEDVPVNDENALMKAVAHQPVSVGIEGGGFDFQFYSSGVFTGECTTYLDHAVTAVGYSQSSAGSKYWIIKNSWGTKWGEGGYMRIKKDIKDKEGLCGLAMKASYPTI
ncbi:hypothetical protein F2Q70_00017882 [Brassica cretica]|uniref:Peptidase C1A papain C-terminal domain-containing protein n=1 Tax=Brassica cretica TaxID=69181 RepID=A0A8S9HXF1_BRACR|nr:hypothetical protein F2Q70_00017882 [Brassica cretica]